MIADHRIEEGIEMSDPNSVWSSAFATASKEGMQVYDDIVARLFTPWTHDLIDRVAPKPGSRGLDIACGPGNVTRALAGRIGPDGSVVGADISPSMLEVARSNPVEPNAAPIQWIESPAAPLPLPDDDADVIVCQQGLQFFPDPVASLAEMRRILRDGGVAGVSIWTTVDEQVFRVLHSAVATTLGDDVARRYTGPFSMSGETAADAARAGGFSSVLVERVTLPVVVDGGVDAMVLSLAASGIAGDLANAPEDVSAALRAEVARLAEPMMDGTTIHDTMTASILLLG